MKINHKSYMVLALAVSSIVSAQAKTPDDQQLKQTNELLGKIVSFKTVKGNGQVPVMAEYLSQQLIQSGFDPEDVKITEVAGTATLVARYRGNGSKKK